MSTYKLPVDLSPLQRAQLKFAYHIILIALFNGGLAVIALLSQGKLSWETVIISALSQSTLAVLDTLKKYYSASNQPALSTMFDLVRNEAAANLPAAPTYTKNEQALGNALNNFFSLQSDSSPNAAANATRIASPSSVPTEASTSAQGLQPVAASQTNAPYPPIPTSAEQITTLPNIAAIHSAG